MTFAQLAAFVRIIEFASLSKAAASLRVAQPALSRQLRKLENELGQQLVFRHPWGVSVTPAGEALLIHAKQILHSVNAAQSAVTATANDPAGLVTLGVPTSIAQILLPTFADRMRKKYPRVHLQLVDGFSSALHQRALIGALDLSVLYDDQALGPLVTSPLLSEELMLIAPAGWREATVATRPLVQSLSMLLPARPNRLRLLAEQWSPGIAPVVEVDSFTALIAMVADSQGFTLLPASSVHDLITYGKVTTLPLEPSLHRKLVIARGPTSAPSAALTSAALEFSALVQERSGKEWKALNNCDEVLLGH